jgi:hypothetical protein
MHAGSSKRLPASETERCQIVGFGLDLLNENEQAIPALLPLQGVVSS